MKRLMTLVFTAILVCAVGCTSKADPKLNLVFKPEVKAGIVAKVGVKEVTEEDLFKGMEGMVDQAQMKEFDIKFNRLRAFVLEYFMNQDPRKGNLTNDEFLEKFILPKNVAVTDKEVFSLAKEKAIPADQVKEKDMQEKIRYFIGMQKKRDYIEKWLSRLTSKTNVIVYLTLPTGKEEMIKSAVPSFKFESNASDKVLVIGKTAFSGEELFSSIRNDIYESQMELYNVKLNALKALLVDEFVALDPAAKDMKVEDYLNKNVYGKVEVKPAEVEAFIKEKNIPESAVNDQLKERVKDYMQNMARQQTLEKWLAEKTQNMPVEVYFAQPARPVFDVDVKDAVFWGGKDAKVVIAEFTDFECPFCSKGSAVVKQLKELYGNKIKVVFKNFPLPFHENARFAHQVAMCASEQGQDIFWKAYGVFFGDQTKLAANLIKENVKAVGVDMAKLEECLKTDRPEKMIERDIEQAQKLGVNSTPTFYVNGKLVNGAQDISVFKQLIDEELSK